MKFGSGIPHLIKKYFTKQIQMTKPLLHIAEMEDFSEEAVIKLQAHFELIYFDESIDIKTILKKVDIYWFRLSRRIDENVLDKESRCKYLVSPVTGIDHIDEKICTLLGVNILCLKGEVDFLKNIRATAEHTIGLTLALMRNIKQSIDHVNQGGWNRDLFRGEEIYGKKVGIIGIGRLGTITASYFSAFGAEVGYYDSVEKEIPNSYTRYKTLNELYQDCDIISIHVNYDQSTHHMIDEHSFESMSKKPYIINTSRGGVIDEHALLHALTSGKIKGAAIDVIEGEPVITGNVLINYAMINKNLIITPHIGGNTYESFHKTELFMVDKLIKAYA
jgi:D-3-phosphoglycerate dehydrogenase / 2-oxoglutarate reductase